MVTINFIVRSKKKGSLAPVYIRLRDGREIDFKVLTDYKMQPELWSAKSQSFKKNVQMTDSFTYY